MDPCLSDSPGLNRNRTFSVQTTSTQIVLLGFVHSRLPLKISPLTSYMAPFSSGFKSQPSCCQCQDDKRVGALQAKAHRASPPCTLFTVSSSETKKPPYQRSIHSKPVFSSCYYHVMHSHNQPSNHTKLTEQIITFLKNF